jgi:GxxExxY protein
MNPNTLITKRDPQTYAIIGAALEVHRELGHGFLEAVFQEALELEFSLRAIPFRSEVEIPVFYKGNKLACGYRADFICYGEILVEIKALVKLTPREEAQVINYLKATRLQRALLFNFGATSLEHKRLVFGHAETELPASPLLVSPPSLS